MKHFGVTVIDCKYGLELCRDKYAIINKKRSFPVKFGSMKDAYEDEAGTTYTDEWCREYQKKVLENFDLNMQFFASLDHDEFQKELDRFLLKNRKFVEVSDLTAYDGTSGYYMMVLDKFCQVYIGTSNSIKDRIQQHWQKHKSFDRLLFPMNAVYKSILSIDSFRALDTTRIFVYSTKETYIKEDKYISFFSPQYVSNRLAGGKFSKGIDLIKGIKTKQLI